MLTFIFFSDAFEKRDPMQQGTIRVNRAEVSTRASILLFISDDKNMFFAHFFSGFAWLFRAKKFIQLQKNRKSQAWIGGCDVFFLAQRCQKSQDWFHLFDALDFYLEIKDFNNHLLKNQ